LTADELEHAVTILNGWRQAEQAATPAPWETEDSESCWKLFGAVRPYAHPLQLIKAPKRDTPYAEYWPGAADSDFIVAARTAMPALLAVASGVLERHVRRDKPIVTTNLCSQHGFILRGDIEAVRRTHEIEGCPDCTTTEKYVCTRCRHECPDDDEWPCAEVSAVVTTLLAAYPTAASPGPATGGPGATR
jgi:hypothetical protein